MTLVAIFVFDGVEEIELVTVVDLLRRANIRVDLVSIDNKKSVKGSHYIEIVTEITFDNFLETSTIYDGIIIPGGPGIVQILMNQKVIEIVKRFGTLPIQSPSTSSTSTSTSSSNNNKLLAAICAAPQVLGKSGLLINKKVTHYPGCNQFLQDSIIKNDENVIIDGNIITANAAGSSVPFSLKIVEYLKGIDASNQLNSQINPKPIIIQKTTN